jgi:hypothetical protein
MTIGALSYAIDEQDHLVKADEMPTLDHGICPDCNEMLLAA